MSEATQQDSESNKSFFQVRWPGGSPTQEEFLMTLPIRRSLKIWESTIINGEESIAWDTLESDMRAVSTQHPNTIFTVEIKDEDGERWVQYHQDGQHYEAPEVRHIPDFDPSKLRETQHPDPLDLNTPIVQVPTLQDVLQAVLLKIEQHVWDMEADQSPRRRVGQPWRTPTNPTAASPSHPGGRLGASPPAPGDSHSNAPGVQSVRRDNSGASRTYSMSTSRRVFNHWTFAERHELEALALELMAVKNAKLTVVE